MNVACQNCPARLLNEDKVIFNDIGNSIANAMFVIPQHNEDAVNDIIRIYNRASNKVFGDAYRLFYDVKPNTNDVDFVLDNLDYHLHFYPSLGIKHYNVDKYNSLLRRLSNDIVTYNV